MNKMVIDYIRYVLLPTLFYLVKKMPIFPSFDGKLRKIKTELTSMGFTVMFRAESSQAISTSC